MKQTKDSPVSLETSTSVDTDPGFPAKWGERVSQGILNAKAPRLDRTTPDFLSVVRDARTSKYAVTLDAFPGAKAEMTEPDAQPAESANLHLMGATHEVVTSDLELGEIPTLPSASPVVRMRPTDVRAPSTETIDELIDGLPLHVQPQRKKSERLKRGSSARALETPASGASREHRASAPRRARRGPWTVALGAALFAVLLVVAFAVVRLTKSEDVAAAWYQAPINTTVALTVAIQPPPAPLPIPQDRVSLSKAAPMDPGPAPRGEAAALPVRIAPPAESSANVSPRARTADKRPPSDPSGRNDVPRTAHADELESDVGNASLPKAPLPQPSGAVRDLLTGH